MQSPPAEIVILMACYNGEKYVAKQIESIIGQTYIHWKLIIRDDASTDNTKAIIKKYITNFSQKISLVEDDFGNVKSVQNFNLLLKQVSNAPYIMFCDQDDIWLPFKIENTWSEMAKKEQEYGSKMPLLVYTNFKYVDENLKVISSKKEFKTTKVASLKFSHLLTQNPIYGCTVMLNNALRQLVSDIPGQAENHDYWFALTASAFGKICYLNQATILYRQHAANVSGNYDNSSFAKRWKRIISKKNVEDFALKIKMATAFKKIFSDKFDVQTSKIIDEFIFFGKKNKFAWALKNISNNVKRQTFAQTFLFYVSSFLAPKNNKELD